MSPGNGQKEEIVHRYDDIEEEDNQLPNWWLFILFGTIVFMFGYWIVFHTADVGRRAGAGYDGPNRAAYEADVAELKRARLARAPMSDEAIAAVAADPVTLEEGRKVFASTCAACHAAEGQGLVGPNLTDKYWLHGATPAEIAKSVAEGYADKGMPPWGSVLGDDKVRKVTAFVLSMRGRNLPGKEPQGELRE